MCGAHVGGMKLTASRLLTLALLLGVGLVVAGCTAPQESADPGMGDAGGDASVPNGIEPTLPAFDPDAAGAEEGAGDEAAGNETAGDATASP